MHLNTQNHFWLLAGIGPLTAEDVAFENLRNTLKNLDQDGNEIILIGDTNCDFKNSQSSNTKKLKAIYSEYQLEQLIRSYTRVAVTTNENREQNVSKTLIDHFSTTNPNNIQKADVFELGMVDHYLVYGIRKINAGESKTRNKKFLKLVPLAIMTRHYFIVTCSRSIGKPSLAHTKMTLTVWLPSFRRSSTRF